MEKSELIYDRINWIDMAKGYGILMVILGHMNLNWTRWFYSFHIPMFFFLSGYVFNEKKEFDVFLKRKIKTLLIPYFLLGLPLFPFQYLFHYLNGGLNKEIVFGYIIGFLVQCRQWTLWYILCLFILNLFFYFAINKIKSRVKLTLLVVAIMCFGLWYNKYITLFLPFNIDICFVASGYFLFGYLFKCYYKKISEKITLKLSLFIYIIALVVNISSAYYGFIISGQFLDMFCSRYGSIVFTVIASLAGIIHMVILSHWITIGCIKTLGQKSLIFFAWHQTIMIPVVKKCLEYVGILPGNSPLGSFVGVFIEFGLVLLILAICDYVISNTKLRIMIGK